MQAVRKNYTFPIPRPNIKKNHPIAKPLINPAIETNPFFFQIKYTNVIILNNHGEMANTVFIMPIDADVKVSAQDKIIPDQLYTAPNNSIKINDKILFILIFNFTNNI
jgi:hypothetical protein